MGEELNTNTNTHHGTDETHAWRMIKLNISIAE